MSNFVLYVAFVIKLFVNFMISKYNFQQTMVCDFKQNGILENDLKIAWRKEFEKTQLLLKPKLFLNLVLI